MLGDKDLDSQVASNINLGCPFGPISTDFAGSQVAAKFCTN